MANIQQQQKIMPLEWVKESLESASDGGLSDNGSQVLHSACCQSASEPSVKQAIIDTAHKAAELLVDNINDDSLYLLFMWSPEASTLRAVVTDDRKANDAPHVVQCMFSGVPNDGYTESDSLSDTIRFWIRDYLTTSSDYMRFSLVSIYTDSSRDQTSML